MAFTSIDLAYSVHARLSFDPRFSNGFNAANPFGGIILKVDSEVKSCVSDVFEHHEGYLDRQVNSQTPYHRDNYRRMIE